MADHSAKRPIGTRLLLGLLVLGLGCLLAWNWALHTRMGKLETAAAQKHEAASTHPDALLDLAMACNPRPTDVDEWIRSKDGGCLDRKWFCRNASLKTWIQGAARTPSVRLGIRQGDLATVHFLSTSYMELMKEARCSFAEVYFMNPDAALGALSKGLPPMPSDVDDDIKANNAERERKIKELLERLNKGARPSNKEESAPADVDSIL